MKKLYVDGFTIGKNPSEIGGGFVITNEQGSVVEKFDCVKTNFTNNEAELLGIRRALELATIMGTVYTDSSCGLFWTRKGKCKARPDLNEIAKQARTFLEEKSLKLVLVKRNLNKAGIFIENNL